MFGRCRVLRGMGIVIGVLLVGPVLERSLAAGSVLQVPAARGTLSVTLAVPKGFVAEKSAAYQLIELDRPGAGVPVQFSSGIAADGIASGQCGSLVANIPPRAEAKGPRRFRLEAVNKAGVCNKAGLELKPVNDRSFGVWEGKLPVLVYNQGVITNEALPQKESRRSRACFVHPLYGLHGEVITESFPKDHYHHHGLFWAWPHVQIDGKEYDLWTYKNIKQQFVAWLARQSGPEAAVLGVENGWFVDGKKVLTERVWLRPYKSAEGHRALDVSLILVPQVKMTLWGAPAKSYGGLNLRYAPRPLKETYITVPSGKAPQDLPDTPLAWADLTAKFAGAPCATGAAVFVAPHHPNFPPTWLTRHYGILCVGWPGVKPRDFAPGKPVRLDYRIWIHDRQLEPDALRQAYADYSAATAAKWE
jgi:hypothetical protein